MKIMRYHFASTGMVILKMTEYNKCCWSYRDTGRVKWCSHYGKQIIKVRITIWFSNSASGYIHQRIESRDFKIYLYTHIHSSISHSSQESNSMSIDGKRHKPNVVWTYNRILFSIKKERNSDTCWQQSTLTISCWVK